MTNPILSICIPTFNRAAILDLTLTSLTSEAEFLTTNEVEIVISDNFSSDNTKDVAGKYVELHPGKIKYHKNASNIHDKNFEAVFRLASGDFLKFNNDNLIFKAGAMAKMLNAIKSEMPEKPVLFFLNGNTTVIDDATLCSNLNEFVSHCSYISTWGGAFGIWKTDFLSINDFSSLSHLKLVQTDILLRLMATGKKTKVYNRPFFDGINVGRKGGYNIAEVFGKNYLYILNIHRRNGQLADAVYAQEKKLILLNHIIPFYFTADHDFQKGNFFENLSEYKEETYFYEAIESMIFQNFAFKR